MHRVGRCDECQAEAVSLSLSHSLPLSLSLLSPSPSLPSAPVPHLEVMEGNKQVSDPRPELSTVLVQRLKDRFEKK